MIGGFRGISGMSGSNGSSGRVVEGSSGSSGRSDGRSGSEKVPQAARLPCNQLALVLQTWQLIGGELW